MSPDDRRAALVETTLPLLREYGVAVSTRQIADAAGVAEGTIFRVFPDKTALLIATTIRGLTRDPGQDLLSSIDVDADLRTRLEQATERMTVAMKALGRLPEVMRTLMNNNDEAGLQIQALLTDRRKQAHDALAALLEPDRDRLRTNVSQAARILLMMIFSSSGAFDNTDELTSAEIVAVVLDGLLIPTTDNGGSEC